ncbi:MULTISPECIES: DUF222 domain-containing protein [unclassified Corynebacterium]
MTKATQSIAECVAEIEQAYSRLHAAVTEVDSVYFGEIYPYFEKLAALSGTITTIDAAFAFIAERDDAGRHVNSTRAMDYLMNRLGLSYGEAKDRLRNGQTIFGTAPLSDPPPLQDPPEDAEAGAGNGAADGSADGSAADGDAAAAAQAEEERRKQAEERRRKAEEEARIRREREEKARAEAQRKLREKEALRGRYLSIIDRELKHLNAHATPGPNELRNKAIDEAKKRNLKDFAQWLRREVRAANARSRDPFGNRDRFAATRKRHLEFSPADADGGVHVSGYLDGATAALMSQAFAPATRPGTPDLPPEEDKRNYRQRMADQFTAILQEYLGSREKAHPGLGSIIISGTVEDFENLKVDSLLPTNTGHSLTPLDIIRLGAAASDYLCIMDCEDFQPLALGRSKRTASFMQKLALIASELVCSHPGCDRAANACDVHHLQAWYYGGVTDIHNLTLLCRSHHVNNNDRQDGRGNMGHAARDPRSGRVGFVRPGSSDVECNESVAAQEAAGYKLRRQTAAAS